ncbi:MAG: arsenate reductase ArsC [Dehalococcoidia bacterium]|nr:arsenate reductase ArsC [Dehalococcoidia bacterium]
MSFADLDPRAKSELERRVHRESERLRDEFAGIFSHETIERFVMESFAHHAGARVVDIVPIFTRRFARERLLAVAQGTGLMEKSRPEVLFLCVHNAGRSQLAAALTQHLSGGRVSVRSAGSQPADDINDLVRQAAGEMGLDLSQEFPKPLTDEVVEAADVVVTMGCGDACPIYPGKRYMDWEVADPAAAGSLDEVRAIRDDIQGRVEALLAELGITEPA